jgi:hypothetical protein
MQATKKEEDKIPAKVGRSYKFFVVAQKRDAAGQPTEVELLQFDTRPQLRKALEAPEYDRAMFRIFRGFEMVVKIDRRVNLV